MAPEIDTRAGVAAVQDQDLLRALMDTLPDLIYFKDLKSRFTRINRAMARFFGLADPVEALGKSDFDYYAGPQAQIAFDREQEIIRTGAALLDFEERMVARDGREAWFSVCKLPLRDADGKVIGTYGLSRDITAHKHQEEQLRQSETLYHSLVESLPQMILRKDLDLRFTFANQKLCAALGIQLGEVLGKTDFDFFPPELARKYQEDDRTVIRTGKVFETIEEHVASPGQPKSWVHVVKAPIFDFRGYVVGVEGIFWDETELTVARQKLEETQQRYALAVEGANDGIWDWNIQSNEVYYSRRWKEMLGYDESEIGKKLEDWMKRVHPDDLQALRAALHSHLQGRTAHFQSEHRILHRQKAYRWVLSRGLAVRDETGKAVRMAGSQTDVTDRKRAEEELAHQAFYDGLSDLPNRALFLDRLSHAIRRAKRRLTGGAFAVLFLDVDRFKDVNDSLGHGVGDELLKATARRLEETVRPGDTVARLGGDEFAILLDELRAMDDAVDVAERILRSMKEPFVLAGQEVFASASIGIAPGAGETGPEDLLRDADTAMYRAKERGRACYEVFDRDMHSRAVARLQMETDLRKAIERREFRVYYQPIVSTRTGHVAGFEALARWEHPQRGIVSPSEFIPLAEETGLVIPIDFWVLDQACRQTLEWQGRHPEERLTINVNLSTKHFSQSNLVAQVEEILKETGLDPSWLRLEITESVILEDAHSIREMLQKLKGMKIKLYLDDFGTGYSSLGYLHRWPIDSLKIHHSFVGQLGQQDGGKGELVRTITTLATNLDMGVVAEGVETREQLRTLRDLKCEKVQGFLFSRPVPAPQAEVLIGRDLLNGDKMK